ncbi:hypothetical protein RchiOBHm_Chr7g0212801 [Rosa chinensis]|uniref:Uncharacterized protein n=1 Tax=Rosa chinensis TaxID=74649 RepID=A0A2P6PAU2_ROSCH|nr:hypothetical protein RchiOBHm_Chr7g0212801 [Rosa chinensis]
MRRSSRSRMKASSSSSKSRRRFRRPRLVSGEVFWQAQVSLSLHFVGSLLAHNRLYRRKSIFRQIQFHVGTELQCELGFCFGAGVSVLGSAIWKSRCWRLALTVKILISLCF